MKGLVLDAARTGLPGANEEHSIGVRFKSKKARRVYGTESANVQQYDPRIQCPDSLIT
jgi:hypothetical protein